MRRIGRPQRRVPPLGAINHGEYFDRLLLLRKSHPTCSRDGSSNFRVSCCKHDGVQKLLLMHQIPYGLDVGSRGGNAFFPLAKKTPICLRGLVSSKKDKNVPLRTKGNLKGRVLSALHDLRACRLQRGEPTINNLRCANVLLVTCKVTRNSLPLRDLLVSGRQNASLNRGSRSSASTGCDCALLRISYRIQT